jgi:hypothetical protein
VHTDLSALLSSSRLSRHTLEVLEGTEKVAEIEED